MDPKVTNALKYVAALVVAAAGGLLAAEHAGRLTLPPLVDQILAGVVAIGSALGIVSSGHQAPTEPKP